MGYSDQLKETYRISRESDFAYAKWYAKLPDSRKAAFLAEGFQFAYEKIKHEELAANPFATNAMITGRFIEIAHGHDYSPEILAFIRQKIADRSELEWRQRFKDMKMQLGWSDDDIVRYVGAKNGTSTGVDLAIDANLPDFAKLAVCVFEQMRQTSIKTTPAP